MMAGATPHWPDILALARYVESLNFQSIWVVDHLLFEQPSGRERVGLWESWSLVAALAATTSRVEIGTLVLCTAFRNPALLAKMAATVEDISNGRLILGLGAGNNGFEHHMFGYPFERRMSRFVEGLTVIHGLLRTGQVDFEGRHLQARNCELRPRGPRERGPTIMVGTAGHRGLRAAAQYADMWNVPWPRIRNTASGFAELQLLVDEACHDVGREPRTLSRSAAVLVEIPGTPPYPVGYPAWNRELWPPISCSPPELAERLHQFAQAGVDHLQVWVHPSTPAGAEYVAKAVGLMAA
jgi:alkanesulfonate monooxygenase SsuD/methylene tetrahydromethanopterin reductase-like flavin-dependent oxidoreductase (luciferase family)